MKLPVVPASVTLLAANDPYGDLIDFGQKRQTELASKILNASIFGYCHSSTGPGDGGRLDT